ncbi:DUF4235 domain-containing protein [Psychroflexus tropicus]|uniref:DUF4235 domain-containing protein n=1 Tax=Psychroflexus tropicus TaxID=197345 RepID=UPI0003614906|nr:DUF4235 domain-containing protein [Psychroflexus tropicus]
MKTKTYLTEKNFEVVSLVAAFGMSLLAKEVLKTTYEKTTDTPAPDHPSSAQHNLKDVLMFSVGLALVSTGVKLLTKHKIAKHWKKNEGKLPQHLD